VSIPKRIREVWEGEEWHVRLEVRVGTLTLKLDFHTNHTSEIGWDYEKKKFFGYCSEKKNGSPPGRSLEPNDEEESNRQEDQQSKPVEEGTSEVKSFLNENLESILEKRDKEVSGQVDKTVQRFFENPDAFQGQL
jgi:hypothetical protein